MQELLDKRPGGWAKKTGFVQRTSKMTAAKFLQTMVLGIMERPEAGLNDWCK